MSDLIERQAAIDAAIEAADDWDGGCSKERERFIRDALEELPPAQQDMAEKLYLYKCYITDSYGLHHEVIHTSDIRRVTGWEI